MRTIDEAKKAKDEFIERVNAEFGGLEDWEAQKQKALELTGGDSVHIQKDILATKLSQEGYLYAVHIGRCRFTARLEPQDVGLDPENPEHLEFINRYLMLGNKRLLDAEILKRLDRIENKMRHVVNEKYGFPTCAGTFVPYKNIKKMKEEFEKLKAEYFDIREEIVENYDMNRQKTADSYRQFALVVYQIIKRDRYYIPTPDEVEHFVNMTMKHFPTLEQVRSSFYVTLEIGIVQCTAFLAEQAARLELVKQREATYRKELELIDAVLTEESRVQSERERQRLRLEKERVETLIQQEQWKRKAIEEAVAQERERILPEIEQVFADLAGAVYAIIYDIVKKVLETLKTRGSLGPADSKSLACLIEKIDLLCYKPDPDIDLWKRNIQLILGTPAKKRDAGEIQDILQHIKNQSGQIILDLGRVPRSIRGVTLPEIEASLAEVVPIGPRQMRMFADDVSEPDGETTPLVRGNFRITAA